MAYTPINWQTGQTITAEKLNKMDNGWSVESSTSQLFSETVTTEGDSPAVGMLIYLDLITADTLTVTFNGTNYECEKMADETMNHYGGWREEGGEYAPDFSDYPFALFSYDEGNGLLTATGGTYTISAGVTSRTIETSDDFKSAVGASGVPLCCVVGVTTGAEIVEASNAHRLMYFVDPYSNRFFIIASLYVGDASGGQFDFWTPTSSHDVSSVGVVNGLFAINF